MHANLEGSLKNLNKIYRAFSHKGNRLSKSQVRQIIEHGIQKGYESTSDFSDAEIDEILKLIELRDFANYLSSEWNCPDIDDDIIEDYIKI